MSVKPVNFNDTIHLTINSLLCPFFNSAWFPYQIYLPITIEWPVADKSLHEFCDWVVDTPKTHSECENCNHSQILCHFRTSPYLILLCACAAFSEFYFA